MVKKDANAIKLVNYLAYRLKQTTHERRKHSTTEPNFLFRDFN
jgi:hypothetical protein